jgi:pimeloyl-ACP methyl ester carboxylesterase
MVRLKKLFQVVFLMTLTISCQVKNESENFCKSSDGVKICYSQYGDGEELILFVHGYSCDKSYWSNQVEQLKNDYRIVTIDLGGHGKSGIDRDKWTISSFGDDVISVMKLFDFKRAYLVGHSMGSDVILDAASKWDTNNIELFLVDRFNDTPMPWTGDSFEKFYEPFTINFKEHTYDWVKNFMFIPESDSLLIERIAQDMSDAPPNIALPVFRDVFSNNYIPFINDLNDRGVVMTLINSDYQKNNIENLEKVGFEVVVMSNTGHFLMLEQPKLFNKKLEDLIKHKESLDNSMKSVNN